MSYSGETPRFTSLIAGNVHIIGESVYWGDPLTDGSWRITKDGANLKIEIRVAGVWTLKDNIVP